MKKIIAILAICILSTLAHAKTYKLNGDLHVDGFAYKRHHLVSGKLKTASNGLKSFVLKIEDFQTAKVQSLAPLMKADLDDHYEQLIFEGRHQMKSRQMMNGNMMAIKVVCILPKKKALMRSQVSFPLPSISGKEVFNGCAIESSYATEPRHSNHWFKMYGTINL